MKKLISLVLALCMCLGTALALAEADADKLSPEVEKLIKEQLGKIDFDLLKGFEDISEAYDKLDKSIAESTKLIKENIAALNAARDAVLEKVYDAGMKIIENGAYEKIGDTGLKIWVPSVMKPQVLSKADEEEGVVLSYQREDSDEKVKVSVGIVTDKDMKEIEKLEELYDYYALLGSYSMNYLTIGGRNYISYTLAEDNSMGVATFTDDGKVLSITATPYDDLDLYVIAYSMFLSVEEDAEGTKIKLDAEPEPTALPEAKAEGSDSK